MPSQQTVIAITLIGSIIGAIAAALFIFEWIIARAKAMREGGVGPILRWPKFTLALVLFAILCSAVGLWLLFHLPNPRPVQCPAVKECPICPPALAPKSTGTGTPVIKKPRQGPTQGGHDNQQTTIEGSVTQGGNGDCQQNIIGGNGNTNNCVPPLVKASDAQVEIAIKYLRKSPVAGGQHVTISWEYSAENGEELSGQLEKILAGANISSDVTSADHVRTPPDPQIIVYPGLSFAYVVKDNKPLADAIEKSLLKAGIIKMPMKPTKRDLDFPAQNLQIMIRKPT